jgi:hypothetical protein
MPISATTEVVNNSHTLGGGAMFFCAFFAFVASTFILLYGVTEKEKKVLWWLLASGTMWLWGPFVVYGFYFLGSKIVACIDEKNRVEIIIPEKPEVINMNKVEKNP